MLPLVKYRCVLAVRRTLPAVAEQSAWADSRTRPAARVQEFILVSYVRAPARLQRALRATVLSRAISVAHASVARAVLHREHLRSASEVPTVLLEDRTPSRSA